jgi:hypothetical protein
MNQKSDNGRSAFFKASTLYARVKEIKQLSTPPDPDYSFYDDIPDLDDMRVKVNTLNQRFDFNIPNPSDNPDPDEEAGPIDSMSMK